MMLLKLIDPLSCAVPRAARKLFGLPRRPNLGCVIRPGGLGDLVILTKSWLEEGIDIWRMVWVVEKRNKAWTDYLRLPSIVYDQLSGVVLAARSGEGFDWVVNTEQTYGLAAVFACRLTDPGGQVFGFETSRARHLQDHNVPHSLGRDHESDSFKALARAADPRVGLPKLKGQNWREGLSLEFPRGTHNVIALGGKQVPEKSLPVDKWVKLSKWAARNAERVYVVGSAIDTKFSVELAVEAPWIDFNLVGRVPFPETIRLIASARRLYSVDSGLVHVSEFFGTPSTVLFAKENIRTRWAPKTPGSKALLVSEFEEIENEPEA